MYPLEDQICALWQFITNRCLGTIIYILMAWIRTKICSSTEIFSRIHYKLEEEIKPLGSNRSSLVYLRHQCNYPPLWDDDPIKAHSPNDSHKNKTHRYSDYPEPTMMLLMGMKMSLTKYPTKPITTKPSAVLIDTFENSVHQATSDNIKITLIH